MSLEDLGNLGDFIGSIAVIVTLIYLAIQIRQNTATTKVQIRQAISEAQFANINARATDDHLPIIIMKTNRGEPLNQDEMDRLYFHFDAGVISAKDWAAIGEGLRRTLRTDVCLDIWDSLKITYIVDFRCTVDTELLQREET